MVTPSGTGIDVEDVAAATFTLDNGAVGSLHAAYVLRQGQGEVAVAL